MLKKSILALIFVSAMSFLSVGFAISPGAGQAQVQSNMQMMQQNKEQLRQMKRQQQLQQERQHQTRQPRQLPNNGYDY